MFKVNKKKHQKGVNDVVLMFSLLTLDIFHTFSTVSIVDFEQVHVSRINNRIAPNKTPNSEAYSQPCQTSKMERFAKIVKGTLMQI